uniref:Uncharacterized protein n=1 Tax=Helianthus annuus TaxID=4232 RepID=A0A251RTY4_HELAN
MEIPEAPDCSRSPVINPSLHHTNWVSTYFHTKSVLNAGTMRNWLGFLLSIIRSLASLRCLKSVEQYFIIIIDPLWILFQQW